MHLSRPRRDIFFKRRQNNIYRVFLWVFLLAVGGYFARGLFTGTIRSPLEPTPTPTRTANSFALEGDSDFTAGRLEDAITAYQEAAKHDPSNAEIWTKLSRIQTYSSNLLTTDAERAARLQEALTSANKAVELAPDDSTAHAIRAMALDWNAAPVYVGDQVDKYLAEANQEVVRALTLDNQNTLALAMYAEILTDQQKLDQAEANIEQALAADPSLMDVHRVYAYLLESESLYRQAIEEYDRAIEINPNLTFLYLRAGAIYRHLAQQSGDPADPLYDQALDYFEKAARLNEQLGIKDPIPFLSIAKTYTQQGEFFIAGRNVLKALSYDQANADTYGQLGIVYFKSRNYEGSMDALKCAVRGCTPEDSCKARSGCDEEAGEIGMQVEPLALTSNSVVYYYTYGSVLAALSRPGQNYCPQAMDVFADVKAQFSDEPIASGIVAAGEAICHSLASGTSIPTDEPGTPTATPTPPAASATPTP
jgi:tetratricopeptide (TPR) repeat protein